jgi:hypothetical protein
MHILCSDELPWQNLDLMQLYKHLIAHISNSHTVARADNGNFLVESALTTLMPQDIFIFSTGGDDTLSGDDFYQPVSTVQQVY